MYHRVTNDIVAGILADYFWIANIALDKLHKATTEQHAVLTILNIYYWIMLYMQGVISSGKCWFIGSGIECTCICIYIAMVICGMQKLSALSECIDNSTNSLGKHLNMANSDEINVNSV